MSDLFREPEDATPLAPHEQQGLRQSWITHRRDLNEAERAIKTRLNGEVLQDANTSQLIFRVPQLIEYLSSFTALSPGDIIATGTPSGVGFARNPPVFMKAGDVVEVEIASIGVLRNRLEADPS